MDDYFWDLDLEAVEQAAFEKVKSQEENYDDQHLTEISSCPYSQCPGVYRKQECGGQLQPYNSNGVVKFWGCTKYPHCKFKWYPPEEKSEPQLEMELISFREFVVKSLPGAESAIVKNGGVAALLLQAGIDVQKENIVDENMISFPVELYNKIQAQLCSKNAKSKMIVDKKHGCIPSNTVYSIQSQQQQICEEQQVSQQFARIPAAMRENLMQFQIEGVKFGLRKNGRCLIADEMGVGKTLQALALATSFRSEWPLVIIVPASMRLVWAEEVERWLPDLDLGQIHVIEGKQDRIRAENVPQVVITSYEMFGRLSCSNCRKKLRCQFQNSWQSMDCMAQYRWGVVIADESHLLRCTRNELDSEFTEAVTLAIMKTKRAILLSGTPSLSRPFDLYRQIQALRPSLLPPNKKLFADRYCDRHLIPIGKSGRQIWNYSGGSHLMELHLILKSIVMIRRLKSEVAQQLPPLRRQVIRLQQPTFPQSLPSNYTPSHRTGLAKLPHVLEWLFLMLSIPKKTESQTNENDDIETSIQEGAKVVVFAHHKDVMAGLANALEGGKEWRPVPYVMIDGECDSRERQALVQQFHQRDDVRVALLSVTAAGVGLDFSCAQAVIFVELPQEVSYLLQAEARVHRKNCKHPINVYFLCAKGTSDDERWQRLQGRLQSISAIQDGSQQQKFEIQQVTESENLDEIFKCDESNLDGEQQWKDSQSQVSEDFQQILSISISSETEESVRQELWFQVSKYTDRVQLKFGDQGQKFVGISLHLRFLMQEHHIERVVDHIIKNNQKLSNYGLIDLAEDWIVREKIYAALSCAQHFALEWQELRAVHKNQLYGRCLQCPLYNYVQSGDKVCGSTDRILSTSGAQRKDITVPEGSCWKVVKVRINNRLNYTEYEQPFDKDDQRLCLNCAKQVSDCSLSVNAVLSGTNYLFCSAECEINYFCKTSSNALRQQLFKLERGVCCECKADCNKLVKRLSRIQKEDVGWKERRRRVITEVAPRFMQSGYTNALNKLISTALDGNAWHADHIVPVYQGGGLCSVENVRTLCVPCHMDVTKKQIKQRAELRKQRGELQQQTYFVVDDQSQVTQREVPQRKKLKLVRLGSPSLPL